jgi:hypothetical protein
MKICEGGIGYGEAKFTEEHEPIAYEKEVQDTKPPYKWMCPLCLANLTIQRLSEELEEKCTK